MLSSPYFQHALYSIACLSISVNLVGIRRSTEEDKLRVEARISILESVKAQLHNNLNKAGEVVVVDSKELERLMRLANKTPPRPARETDKVLGGDVSWKDIFSGKGPGGAGQEELSRWEREDLEKLRKELDQ